MHLLCTFVFGFCLDFFAFQFFLHGCVLISPLCLSVCVFENTHTCTLSHSDKDDRNSFVEKTSKKICTNINGIFLEIIDVLDKYVV